MKKLLSALVILLICAILIVGGCTNDQTTTPPQSTTPVLTSSSPATTEAGPQYGGTLIRLSSMGPIATIGYPPENIWAEPHICPMIEGLVQEDNKANITPKLATAWEIAPDKLSIKIMLRQGVKFHDGTDFNAQAAKWAMDLYITAKKEALWKSVDIIDDYTIRLNLTKWKNSALATLSYRIYISPTSFEKNGIEWARFNPVGTGPFKFEKFVKDTSLYMTRFDGYWNKGLPYLDAIEWQYIADKMTMTAAFKAGQGHTLMMGTLQYAAEWKAQGGQVSTALTQGGKQSALSLYPDSKNADSPFANLKVRLAVEYAIDKEAICKARGFTFWEPAYQLSFFKSDDYDPSLEKRKYDPAKAKQLLTEAGYPDGFSCKIIAQPGIVDRDAAVAIQNYFTEVGIKADLEFPDSGKFAEYRTQGWHNGVIMTMAGMNPNFGLALDSAVSRTASMCASVAISDTFQQAIDDALSTIEYDTAKTRVLSKVAYEEQVLIPVYYAIEGDPIQAGIHDIGVQDLEGPASYTPDICWIEKSAWIK